MRICVVTLLVGSLGCTGCSGGETPPSPDGDPAAPTRDGAIWSPARGPGIEVLDRGRSLPPARRAEVADLAPDAGAGPFSDMRVEVQIDGRVRTVPCAVPSGSYCDGFALVDGEGRTIAIDTYAYLGPKPSCRARWAEGMRIASISGIWQQRTSGVTALSVVALASCDDLEGARATAGSPAPPSGDVRQLVSGWAPGRPVAVRGVVVARWKSSSGAFGFALQDPDGAARSGLRVTRARTSPVPASAPEVGDWVRVTARTATTGEHLLEL
jgi:hypothetical protein